MMVGGHGVRLAPQTLTPAISAAPFFLALGVHHDPRNRKAEILVNAAVAVEEPALIRLFAREFPHRQFAPLR